MAALASQLSFVAQHSNQCQRTFLRRVGNLQDYDAICGRVVQFRRGLWHRGTTHQVSIGHPISCGQVSDGCDWVVGAFESDAFALLHEKRLPDSYSDDPLDVACPELLLSQS
eukprot:768353-Rhodomonas_salina.1